MSTNLGTLKVILGVDMTALTAANAGMLQFERNTVHSLNTMAQRFRTFGYLATATVTAPMIMAGKSVVKMASEYEFSMQKIVGLTGVAQDTVNKWSDSILKMGPEVAKSPKELAEALYFISSSGIKGAQAMDVLRLSAKAATAGLGETQDVASILTSVLNAYKGTGITAAYATDVLIAAIREGKAEAPGFVTSLGSVIPIAAQLGLSFDQVAGGMAATTLSGASAANAATYLRNYLMKLLHPAAQSEEALRKLGSSSEELRKILAEQGLMASLERVNNLTKQWGVETLGKIFPNIRSLLLVLSVAGKNFEYNSELMKRVTASTGSLGKAFAAVADTIKVRYDIALSTAQSSLISLGKSIAETFLPILEKWIKKLIELINTFNNLSEEEKRHKLVMLAWIAAIGPMTLGISLIIYSLSALITIITRVTTAFKFLKVVMLANPWIAVATLLLTAGGALIKYSNKIRDAAKDNDSFYTTLVNVNGQLKKLKDLSAMDFAEMDFMQLQKHSNWAQNAVVQQLKRVKYYYEQAGVSAEEYDKATKATAEGKPGLKGTKLWDDWKWAERTLKVHGQFAAQIDIENNKLEIYKQQVIDSKSALDNFINSSGKIVTVVDDVTNGMDEQIEALERLDSEWLKIHKDVWKITQSEIFKVTQPNQKTGMANYTFPKLKVPEYKFSDFAAGTAAKELLGEDKIISDMNKELAKQAILGSLLTDTYDSLTTQIDIHRNALSALYDMGVTEGNPMYDNLITKLRELMSAQDEVAFSAKRMGNILSGIAVDLASNIGASLAGTQNAWMGMVDAVIQGGQQVIHMLLAEAVAAMIAKEAHKGVIGLITMAVGLGGLAALWEGYKSRVADAAKMAHGGEVPPGYPNDSYPAWLTSGETVNPPKALSGKQFQPATIEGDVVFHIKDDELEGLLRKRSTRKSIY
jgi:TP901 family phage tail tape measure protein